MDQTSSLPPFGFASFDKFEKVSKFEKSIITLQTECNKVSCYISYDKNSVLSSGLGQEWWMVLCSWNHQRIVCFDAS